jgi:hypothetical protein
LTGNPAFPLVRDCLDAPSSALQAMAPTAADRSALVAEVVAPQGPPAGRWGGLAGWLGAGCSCCGAEAACWAGANSAFEIVITGVQRGDGSVARAIPLGSAGQDGAVRAARSASSLRRYWKPPTKSTA